MTQTTYCDACGEPIRRQDRDRHVHVSVNDLGLLLTLGEHSLSRTLDFHRSCYLASVEPTWAELDAR